LRADSSESVVGEQRLREQSEQEMRRLILQTEVDHNPPTRWLFQQAGLGAGMRVLDVGCGGRRR
jgi:cyclopropane fatty-acyl-phospholipid synthase-like methyltransferase